MINGSKEKEMEKRKLSQPLSHHLQEKGNGKEETITARLTAPPRKSKWKKGNCNITYENQWVKFQHDSAADSNNINQKYMYVWKEEEKINKNKPHNVE